MNKAEFVEQIAQKADLSRRDAEQAVDATLKTIEEQLARGGRSPSPGSGSSTSEPQRPAGSQPADGRNDPDQGRAGSPLQRRLEAQAGRQHLGTRSGLSSSLLPPPPLPSPLPPPPPPSLVDNSMAGPAGPARTAFSSRRAARAPARRAARRTSGRRP